MSWRTLTLEDFEAKLSHDELMTYSGNATFDVDVVEQTIEAAADHVRGFLRSNRAVVMCETEHTLPAMLLSPALDYAVFNLLKRYDVNPNEARTEAWRNANSLFEKVAKGDITPEPGAETTDDTSVAAPSISVKAPIL